MNATPQRPRNKPDTLPQDGHASAGTDVALARLLQLASPALPVGAYSYSQGLEAAVEAGLVHDAASARTWIGDVLDYAVARLEAPVWSRLYAAWSAQDAQAVAQWNDFFLCTRESSELRAETVQMGYSLRQLLLELGALCPCRRRHLHQGR